MTPGSDNPPYAQLQPGEFLVGGYSNFLFSFKEITAAPMENAITLLAPFCDVAAAEKDAADLALLAPTFMLGWYVQEQPQPITREPRDSPPLRKKKKEKHFWQSFSPLFLTRPPPPAFSFSAHPPLPSKRSSH